MTWIKEYETTLRKRYTKLGRHVRFIENTTTRYKKFHNRAIFRFERNELLRDDPDHYNSYFYYDRFDRAKQYRFVADMRRKLSKRDDLKVRNHWYEVVVYYNNFADLWKLIPSDCKNDLAALEVMDPQAQQAVDNFVHDYPISLKVKGKLPYGEYRYRLYVADGSRVRGSIGSETLGLIHDTLLNYSNDVKITETMRYNRTRTWATSPYYFYAKTLDWLPIVCIMDARYIKKIEQFKTKKEIQNEAGNQSTS